MGHPVDEVADDAALSASLARARAEGLSVIALGEGSNIVLAGDIEAVVVRQRDRDFELLKDSGGEVLLRCFAGTNWHSLVEASLAAGYQGLENLALIPGCVGAAPVQNIGAYGVELEQYVEAVHAIEIASGEVLELDQEACQFAYRDSIFKGELQDRCVINAVDLRLPKAGAVNVKYPALAEHLEAL